MNAFHNEAGGHRIQRVPPTERRGRVHTSTVTCAVVDSDKVETRIDESELSFRWFSGTGCGGQHRNKHQNCLELTHLPSGLSASAQGRSRESNKRDCMIALEAKLGTLRQGGEACRVNTIRAAQIGSGERGDKRRTYRFQDDRVVDHVTGKGASCSRFMRGQVDLLWPTA